MYDFWGFKPLEQTHQGPQANGVWARFGRLAADSYLSGLCSTLMLTTPTVLLADKVLNGGGEISLTQEEREILASFNLPRGFGEDRVTPLVDGQFEGGTRATIDMLKRIDMISELPTTPTHVTQPHQILFGSTIRCQSLSVLWDIVFDDLQKGSPFGRVKPWVMEELQILGFATLGPPIPDGKPGRPPRRIIVNSWGRKFAEVTRNCGIEVTDVHRQSARKRVIRSKVQRFNTADSLASGYLVRGYDVPANVIKGMSNYGKQTLRIGIEEVE